MLQLSVVRLVVLSVLAASWVVKADDLVFKLKGKGVKTLTFDQLEKISPPHDLPVYEIHEAKDVTYQVSDLRSVLTAVYGELWKNSDEILFTCLDGYQPSIPVAKIKEFTSALAFARKGAKEFSLIAVIDKNKKVDLGPYYLVWDNLKNKRLRSGEVHDWPYQVTTVDLIQFSDRFPKLSPPENSSPQVKRGFVAYRQNCFACHQINGEGGGKAPELNYPVNVTEYFKESVLRKYIVDPMSVRVNAQMPGFEDEDHILNDIVAYLKAMSKKKIKPNPPVPE
jgi:mono/diheme cytochrome c family protein